MQDAQLTLHTTRRNSSHNSGRSSRQNTTDSSQKMNPNQSAHMPNAQTERDEATSATLNGARSNAPTPDQSPRLSYREPVSDLDPPAPTHFDLSLLDAAATLDAPLITEPTISQTAILAHTPQDWVAHALPTQDLSGQTLAEKTLAEKTLAESILAGQQSTEPSQPTTGPTDRLLVVPEALSPTDPIAKTSIETGTKSVKTHPLALRAQEVIEPKIRAAQITGSDAIKSHIVEGPTQTTSPAQTIDQTIGLTHIKGPQTQSSRNIQPINHASSIIGQTIDKQPAPLTGERPSHVGASLPALEASLSPGKVSNSLLTIKAAPILDTSAQTLNARQTAALVTDANPQLTGQAREDIKTATKAQTGIEAQISSTLSEAQKDRAADKKAGHKISHDLISLEKTDANLARQANIKTGQAPFNITPPTSDLANPLAAPITAVTGVMANTPLPSSAPVTAQPFAVMAEDNLNRVAQAIIQVNKANNTMQVQLDPPEMGRVYIDFIFETEQLSKIVIKFDTAEAQAQLRQQSHILIQGLQESGIEFAPLEFQMNQNRSQENSTSLDFFLSESKDVEDELLNIETPFIKAKPYNMNGHTNGRLDLRL